MEIDPNKTEYNFCVLVKHIRQGQPRPYADGVYESEITFTGKNISTKPEKTTIVIGGNLGPDLAKRYVKLMVHNFVDDVKNGMEPYLQHFSEVRRDAGSITYRAIVIEPFLD